MSDSRPLVGLAWPIYIDLFLQFLVSNIGQMMIGRYSSQAVAAIGNANQIINILNLILFTIAMTSTILIALRVGSAEHQRAQRIFSTTVMVNVTIGTLLSIFIVLFHKQLFTLLKVPAELLGLAGDYIVIVGSFLWIQGLFLTLVACLKSFFMMRQIVLVAVVMNIMAIGGNWLLIDVLGVVGVAWSTIISRIAGLVILILIFRRNVPVSFSFKSLTPFPKNTIIKIFRIGVPMGVEDLSYNIAQFVILVMINTLGTMEVAARVYAGILAIFCYLYSSALGQASQVISARLAGSGEIERLNKQIRKTVLLAISTVLFTTSLVVIFGKHILLLFTQDKRVIALVSSVLIVELWLEVARTINIIMVRTMQSVGDVNYPVKVGLIAMWTIQVGLSYVLSIVADLGLLGIWIGMALDESVRALLFIRRWKKGHWREIAVRFSASHDE
ncbi:MAG: MATE family efflux transporter [Sphaerochaetaceae bacterium]|jgi:putative MATE family efflux protein|nr:MATE family efflux transporter [Sphaerochaetaceae bacterium]NLO61727.1 MATE family efflux transporter [Spirochaetales bacterium]MDD2405758.1 MATE family efflux transporter [Sphaerochaetaceae bacterium]MDD4259219.1 MATE family efflux transporter [Sphaerochaetaceae bacterium]MDD4763181.1 MATE family efflux transporter [Sphaerochaetaceae bacterium]